MTNDYLNNYLIQKTIWRTQNTFPVIISNLTSFWVTLILCQKTFLRINNCHNEIVAIEKKVDWNWGFNPEIT